MKYWLVRCTLLLFVSIGLISCNQETNEQQIDQEYMNSESYSDFEQESSQEMSQKENRIEGISGYIPKLPECNSINSVSLPLVIDQQSLTNMQQSSSDCGINASNRDSEFRLSPLGKNALQGVEVYWVLVDWQSVYTDQEVIIATFQGEKLLSFKTVGTYQKNVTRDVSSKMQARMNGDMIRITSETDRDIKYPIDQNNTIISEYTIDAQGAIREQ